VIEIVVCVGSSCHVRGARGIIERYSELIAERGLSERVLLKGCFCMDRCTEGVNIKIGDDFFRAASLAEAQQLFEKAVLGRLEGEVSCP
jgi:NADH:ubiquinone oxidoreductase subunit E